MKRTPFIKKLMAGFLALTLFIGVVPRSRADDSLWETAKEYTATLVEAAKTALEAAEALAKLVEIAQAELEAAEAALAAAAGAGAAAVAAAAARVGKAASALAAARTALAVARQAAKVAAAVALAVAGGTAIGQGVDWLISWCWDPVCDLTALQIGGGPIYVPATQAEVDQTLNAMLGVLSAEEVTVSDLDPTSYQLLSAQIHMGIGFARGAAAYTAGRAQEVLEASEELKAELNDLPTAILNFSDYLEEVVVELPLEELRMAREQYDEEVQAALALFREERAKSMEKGDRQTVAKIDEAIKQLDKATQHFDAGLTKLSGVPARQPLVGPGGLSKNLTLGGFQKFISDCATKGRDCLPPEEIELVNILMKAAGVYSPGVPNYGDEIAKWDAFFGDNSKQEAILASYGSKGMTVAEMFRSSVVDKSKKGMWLNSDLEASPLTIWARKLLGPNAGDSVEAISSGGCTVTKVQEVTNHLGLMLSAISILMLAGFAVAYRRRSRRVS